MRGSAAFRTSVTPGGALAGPWVRNPLWNAARSVPSLDLRFADNKSLVDATTGQNLVTFTRASSGTYVNNQGVIKTATTNEVRFDHAITSSVTNLLLRSEEFDNASWTKAQGSITANAVVAPNGLTTADAFIENTATAQHAVLFGVTVSANTTYTASCYLKSAGRSTGWLQFNNGSYANGVRAIFDLSAGTASALNFGSGSGATASILPAGNGWFRVSISGIIDSSSTSGVFAVYLNNGLSYTGDGTSGIYLWGAQLEQSSTVGEYVQTTTAPATASKTESLGLLVEEQRTNLLLRSEEFDNASWTKFNSSIVANALAAPNGTTTGDKIIESADNSVHIATQNATVSSGATATISLYTKAAERSQIILWIQNSSDRTFAKFNLSTESYSSGALGTGVFSSASIQPVGNGWYRISLTGSLGGRTLYQIQIGIVDASGNESYTGDGTSGIYLWGAQLEAGSFPTSYIPTTTATATRSADVASITGSNFSSWYRQDEGTVFANWSYPVTPSQFPRIWQFTEGAAGSANTFSISTNFVNHNRFGARAQNVALFDTQQGPDATINTPMRSAMALKSGSIGFVGNGVTPTNNSGSMPSGIDRCYIGSLDGGLFLTGHIRRLTYWPQRLSNSTLQQITQ